MPNVPMIRPSFDFSGSFEVETQVVRPSGQVSFSTLVMIGSRCRRPASLVGQRLLGVLLGEEIAIGLADGLARIVQAEFHRVRTADPQGIGSQGP